MKLHKMAQTKKVAPAPVVQPSGAHEALAQLFEDMLVHFAGATHPIVTMLQALKPGIVRDLATVPEEVLRNAAADFAAKFDHIARAGLEHVVAEAEAVLAHPSAGGDND